MRIHQKESIDFAPGLHNVIKRLNNVEFYAVDTFHSSPFYYKTIPVLIHDVYHSTNLIQIYGARALIAMRENVIMINNHPIRQVKIVGRISEYFIKELKNTVFYFLTIDDSSGFEINCKVTKSMLIGSGLKHYNCEGYLVEIVGSCHIYNDQFEIETTSLNILTDNLVQEMIFWKEVLSLREELGKPWVQLPQIDDDDVTSYNKIKFDPKTLRKKLLQKDVVMNNYEATIDLDLDSSIYVRKLMLNPIRTRQIDTLEIESVEAKYPTQEVLDTKQLTKLPIYIYKSLSSDSEWLTISDIKRFIITEEQEVIILLISWIIDNNQPTFNLNEPYRSVKMNKFLTKVANLKFNNQVIDMTISDVKIKSMNDMKGEIFHNARHELQKRNLIKCYKDKHCDTKELLVVIKHIKEILETLEKNSFVCFQTSNFQSYHNQEMKSSLNVELELIQILVLSVILPAHDDKWRFSRTLKQWMCESTERSLNP